MIEVIALNIAESSHLHQMIHLLTPEKQYRLSRIKHPLSARQVLAGDLLTRAVICDRLGMDNQSIKFTYNDYGKPVLSRPTDYHFNVSHAGEWVVMALSAAEVGIDIEQVVLLDLEIARHFFSTGENQQLNEVPAAEKLEYFFQIWTLKESYSKMIGRGLSLDANSFTIQPGSSDADSCLVPPDPSPVFFRQYALDAAYKLAVCGRESCFAEQIILLTEDFLLKILLSC